MNVNGSLLLNWLTLCEFGRYAVADGEADDACKLDGSVSVVSMADFACGSIRPMDFPAVDAINRYRVWQISPAVDAIKPYRVRRISPAVDAINPYRVRRISPAIDAINL
jgi:hypothetical protein